MFRGLFDGYEFDGDQASSIGDLIAEEFEHTCTISEKETFKPVRDGFDIV